MVAKTAHVPTLIGEVTVRRKKSKAISDASSTNTKYETEPIKYEEPFEQRLPQSLVPNEIGHRWPDGPDDLIVAVHRETIGTQRRFGLRIWISERAARAGKRLLWIMILVPTLAYALATRDHGIVKKVLEEMLRIVK